MTTGLVIGRFQPTHISHYETFEYAKEKGIDHLIVVKGSAEKCRIPRHPFTSDECVDMLNSHEFEAAKLQSKLDAATEESRLLIAARNEKGEQLGELRREIEQLKRERDQRDLEQQAKALDDFANLTIFPSMGHGFSDGYCAGFEAALSAAARNAEQLRQQAKGD